MSMDELNAKEIEDYLEQRYATIRIVNSLGNTAYGSDDWLKKLNKAIESNQRPSGAWDQDRWCHYPLAWFSEKELRDIESYLSVNREHDWVGRALHPQEKT